MPLQNLLPRVLSWVLNQVVLPGESVDPFTLALALRIVDVCLIMRRFKMSSDIRLSVE
jgi:hypothetical protein